MIANGYISASEISDCFSEGQNLSKNWLVEQCLNLNLDLKTVFFCGGWLGSLFLDHRLIFNKVRSFDIDPKYELLADELNRTLLLEDWKFKAVTADIHDINFTSHTYTVKRKNGTLCELTDSPDTIINTSCEHIENFSDWHDRIPAGKLMILQSNNGQEIKDHINCSTSLEDFAAQTPLSKELYQGELSLPKFKRFMRIGYR